jgi:predicted anti-sigma-YlaC factor YlaD
MNCDTARQDLLDSLHGSITAEVRSQLDAHIGDCDACRRFAAVQQSIDARLAAAFPAATFPSAEFRRSLQQRLVDQTTAKWPEFLPDVAHLAGCGLAILILIMVFPEYSRTLLPAGTAFTGITYVLQSLVGTVSSDPRTSGFR